MLLGDVMGGPQPSFSFDLFMEIQTGNHSYRCDLSHEQSHLPTLNCQKNIKKQADLDVTKGHQLWGMISADVHLYTCMLECIESYSVQNITSRKVMCTCPTQKLCFLWHVATLSTPSLHTDPATLPQHEQMMRASSVILTNYSLLWQHIDANKLLPKLLDMSLIDKVKKKEVESYQQSCGQNSVIIDALFCRDNTPDALVTVCDKLQTTSGKEHIAQHILRGTVNSVFRFRQIGEV